MMSNEQNLTVEYFLQEGSDNLGDLLKNVDKVCSVSRTKSAKCCEKLSGLFAMINHLENLRDTYENCNVFVDEKFETVRVEVNDILGKKQYFVLISEKEGKLKIKEHSLPDLDSLSSKFNDIVTAVEVFTDTLRHLSDYFEVMQDLDECCWIIDPVNPSSKDNFRRIVVGDDVSVVVTVDCGCGREMPRVSVLGPSAIVGSLLTRVHEYRELWDPQLGINNLLNMLGLSEFPQKPASVDLEMEPTELECGICLSSRDLQGALPTVVCERASCRLNYHKHCLYQWLSAVSGNVQTFNIIHGECPTCSTPICCPVVQLSF